jgi:hypothetical protein
MEQKAGIINRVARALRLKPASGGKAISSVKMSTKVSTKPKSGNKAAKKINKDKKK